MMKQFFMFIFVVATSSISVFAQGNELQLARQFATNGEPQKALDIYQKLYKQDNDTYYNVYVNSLLSFKKYDEAVIVLKKMIRKNPENHEYIIVLGSAYAQQGKADKADALYDDLIKNLQPDQGEIAGMAAQFYQNANVDYAIKVFQQGRKLLHSDELFTYELINLYRYKRDKAALTEEYLNFLPLNPTFINQAKNAFAGIYENEDDYNILKSALLKRIQKDPQQSIYADLLTWQFLQQKDFDQAAQKLNGHTDMPPILHKDPRYP